MLIHQDFESDSADIHDNAPWLARHHVELKSLLKMGSSLPFQGIQQRAWSALMRTRTTIDRFEIISWRRKIMSKVNVRYIVNDVDAAIPFYTDMLGFKLEMHPAPGFASLSRGDLQLLLNRPGAGGAGQAMPGGQQPAPGGWNRIQIEVENLEATVERLKSEGGQFRNEIVTGNGGKQILVEDPSGNPIELFQPF
jgi:catechol 2,3-dioxygenase-like lactoylglutathione lyase family enzyme